MRVPICVPSAVSSAATAAATALPSDGGGKEGDGGRVCVQAEDPAPYVGSYRRTTQRTVRHRTDVRPAYVPTPHRHPHRTWPHWQFTWGERVPMPLLTWVLSNSWAVVGRRGLVGFRCIDFEVWGGWAFLYLISLRAMGYTQYGRTASQ